MNIYSFTTSAAYVFDDKKLFEIDDVLVSIENSTQNPLPPYTDCVVLDLFEEIDETHIPMVKLLADTHGILYIRLSTIHQMLLSNQIAIKTDPRRSEKESIAMKRGHKEWAI